MKICAGIVLFHPDYDRLKQNIDAVLPQVDKIILVNNAPEEFEGLQRAFGGSKLTWINNEENLGIAGALNQLLAAASNDGYKWVLTLDQDSVCSDGLVDKLFFASCGYSNAAMVAPRIVENGKVWEDGVRTEKFKRSADALSEAADIEDVPFCITSGTLTNIEAVQNAGGFDERLFIDEVDRDICIRLRYRGHRIIRVNTAALQHEFGMELVRRRIFFRVYEYRNYAPERVYFQIRNMIYMIRKYGADYKPRPVWHLFRPFLTFFVKFIFEPQRLGRLSAFVRGYTAGLVMKL